MKKAAKIRVFFSWFVLALAFTLISATLPGSTELSAADNAVYSKAYSAALDKAQKSTIQVYKNAAELKRDFSRVGIKSVDRLRDLAEERKNHLLSIIEEYPEIVIMSKLPSELRDSLPKEISQFIEQETEIEGELEVLHFDDFERSISWEKFFVKTSNGKTLEIHPSGQKPDLMSGTKVKIKGVKIDKHLAVKDKNEIKVLEAPLTAQLISMKKVAVILFNFQNNATQPYTVDHARQVTFTALNSANAYYQETSFNKVGLQGKVLPEGDIYGWYTIPHDNTACNYSTWASAARTAAQANGFSSTGYNVIIYAFPQTAACSWWGLGTIGGSPASSWINGSYALRVVAHEMGHNFGAHHASSYSCTDSANNRVPISNNCTSSEYGDPFDIMGSSSYHFNNFHKGRLGFLSSSSTQTVTSNGYYSIAPVEWESGGIQSLRIVRERDGSGNPTQYYYLEFRQPYGFDNFSSAAPVVQGVSIRLAPEYSTIRQSQLIDTNASTTSFSDAALAVNSEFFDSVTGVNIRTTGVSQSGASVYITFGAGSCVRANPSLVVSPASQWGFPGESLNYTVSVTNNDSSACGTSSFSITPSLPATGWSQTPSSLSEQLSPGASVTRTVSIKSPTGVAEGLYNFSETALNLSESAFSRTGSAQYNVKPVDTTAPVITITSPKDGAILPAKRSTNISATATDESGISRINIYINNTVVKTCTNTSSCQYNWNISKVASGQHIIKIRAQDNAKPTTNSSSKSITVVKN